MQNEKERETREKVDHLVEDVVNPLQVQMLFPKLTKERATVSLILPW